MKNRALSLAMIAWSALGAACGDDANGGGAGAGGTAAAGTGVAGRVRVLVQLVAARRVVPRAEAALVVRLRQAALAVPLVAVARLVAAAVRSR